MTFDDRAHTPKTSGHEMPDSPSIEDRARAAILRALGPAAAAMDLPLAMGATPGWDSLGHMTVVVSLEQEFGIAFPAYELPRLTTLGSIVRAIQDVLPG